MKKEYIAPETYYVLVESASMINSSPYSFDGQSLDTTESITPEDADCAASRSLFWED